MTGGDRTSDVRKDWEVGATSLGVIFALFWVSYACHRSETHK